MPIWQMLREWFGSRYERIWSASRTGRRWLVALLTLVAVAGLIAAGSLGSQVHLQVNDVAPQDIRAPRTMIDRPRTEQLRQEAAGRVQDVYRIRPEVGEAVQGDLRRIFDVLQQARQLVQGSQQTPENDEPQAGPASGNPTAARDEAVRLMKTSWKFALPDTTYQALLDSEPDVIERLELDLSNIMAEEMSKTIAEGDILTFQREAHDVAYTLPYSTALLDFAAATASNLIRPNFFVDEQLTEQNRIEARESVRPIMIVEGEAIVRQNQRISEDDLVRLRDAGLLREGSTLPIIIGSVLLSFLLISLFTVYLGRFKPTILQDVNRLTLISLIAVGALLLSISLQTISPYLMPLGTVGVLLTILIDPITALFAMVLIGYTAALITGGSVLEIMVMVAGGVSAIFGVFKVTQRSDIMRASVIAALVQSGMIFSLNLLNDLAPLASRSFWLDMMFGAVNGIVLTGFLSIGVLPYAENLFGILTSMKLLELSNPNQPLLRRLLMEAPGTYHHSLMVANLAEAAAEEVGGNSLLVRVGAFYHDIGKLKRPYFFIENQMGGENPHDKISPNLSALIISAHTKEGLELAKMHNLPLALRPFITEHHGTSLIRYFYRKAQEQSPDARIEERDFRYEGPRPQSRETAIVMLADGCEAAVRAMNGGDPAQIEMTVRKIIDDRLHDRQLDQCDLNLRDLDRIAAIFTRLLTGVFHARIEYPDALVQQAERGAGKSARYTEHRKRA